MSRTYDSGLSKPLPTLVREGIVAKLAPTLRSQGAFARAIVEFPFVMQGSEYDLEVLLDLVQQCPAYVVAVGDISAKRAGSAGQYVGDLAVEVYCVTNHMRHVVTGRISADGPAAVVDTLDPGIEVMRELARMLLTDQYPITGGQSQAGNAYSVYGTKAKELIYEGEREILSHREHTVWGVRFHVTLELQANMLRGATQLLEEIHAMHSIGAGESPDDATPALIETLTDVS